MTVRRKIVSSHLTTCNVINNGDAVSLNLVNQAGHAVSVEMTVEQAQSVLMTLPQLLSNAFKARTGNEQTRYVFPMGEWSIEGTSDAKCLIVTLMTTDGFQVAFGMPFGDCQALGAALHRAADAAIESDASLEIDSALRMPAALN